MLLARVALISTNAINVAPFTLCISAIFVPKDFRVQNLPLLPSLHMPGLGLPTPIRVNRLVPLLLHYTPSATLYLADGFIHGFPLHFEGPRLAYAAPNLLSARQQPSVVDAKLAKELTAQRIAGPFDTPPFSQFRISPLGVVPKKTPGAYRLIHHLSYPTGGSVNDGIAFAHSTVSYARIDDAIQLIKQAGVGCFLAKTDIQNAFRIIPIRPDDYNLLGMCWRGQYYYDRCMPMGCSSSCQTFEAFSTAIEWIAKRLLGIPLMIHLLDDFLIVVRSRDGCKAQLRTFLALCDYLGIPMAPEKTIGPSSVLSFAGIELDSDHMEARLPADKLAKCKLLITVFLRRKKVPLKDLQSLIGVLNFACSVVVPGRAFLRRLIDLTKGAKKSHHSIRLTRAAKADLV